MFWRLRRTSGLEPNRATGRKAAMLAGYTQTEPVNERGGTAWMKLSLALD